MKRVNLKLSEAVHRAAKLAAAERGVSLNDWIVMCMWDGFRDSEVARMVVDAELRAQRRQET